MRCIGCVDRHEEGKRTHLSICLLGFVVFPTALLLVVAIGRGSAALFYLSGAAEATGCRAGFGNVLQAASDIDDGAFLGVFGDIEDVVTAKAFLCRGMSLVPVPSRCVFAQKHKTYSDEDDQNARYDERYAPCLVARQSVVDERLVHRRHDEVRDATTQVTQTAGQSIRGTDDVLVEEACRPYLAWYETTTKDTDEETQSIESRSIDHCAREEGRYSACQQAACECEAWTEAITAGPGNEAHDECGGQCDDVAVCDLILLHVDIARNDICQEGREC